MIRSFRCPDTEELFVSGTTHRFNSFKAVAERKLQQLDSAETLDFLRAPPGNRLEALKGDLRGLHSIRINEQWRVIFRWTKNGPEAVAIVDYHR